MTYLFQEILAQKDKSVNNCCLPQEVPENQIVWANGLYIWADSFSSLDNMCLHLSKQIIYQAVYISILALSFTVSTKPKLIVRRFAQFLP